MASLLADIVFVAIGGATGAVCRYGIQQSTPVLFEKHYYTLAINLIGCFAIGVQRGQCPGLAQPPANSRLPRRLHHLLDVCTRCFRPYPDRAGASIGALCRKQRYRRDIALRARAETHRENNQHNNIGRLTGWNNCSHKPLPTPSKTE